MINQHKNQALIIGAGIAGLSAAWWLKQQGWDIVVIDKAADLSTNGYMLSLSSPGYNVAEKMGLMDDLIQYNRHYRENSYLDMTGKEIMRLDYHKLADGLKWSTLTRSELASVLYRRVIKQGTKVLFSTEIKEYSQTDEKVIATFNDGSSVDADLMIAADGARSQMRQRLFDNEAQCIERLGYKAAAFNVANTSGLDRDFISYADVGKLAQCYALSKTHLATLFVWRSDDARYPATNAERKHLLETVFAASHPEIHQWLHELDNETSIYFDDLTMVCLPQWSQGRVLLLGDAAHCLSLISGQGAGTAMTSAYFLAQTLQKHEVANALKAHETIMRPIVHRLQNRSRNIAKWFIPANEFSFKARNFVMSHLPEKLLGWYLFKGIQSDVKAASKGLML